MIRMERSMDEKRFVLEEYERGIMVLQEKAVKKSASLLIEIAVLQSQKKELLKIVSGSQALKRERMLLGLGWAKIAKVDARLLKIVEYGLKLKAELKLKTNESEVGSGAELTNLRNEYKMLRQEKIDSDKIYKKLLWTDYRILETEWAEQKLISISSKLKTLKYKLKFGSHIRVETLAVRNLTEKISTLGYSRTDHAKVKASIYALAGVSV